MYFSPTFLILLHQKISQNLKNHIFLDKNNHKKIRKFLIFHHILFCTCSLNL